MGLLSQIEERFADFNGSPRLEQAFGSWQKRHACLSGFAGTEELIAFLRGRLGEYRERDEAVFALCREAQAEAKAPEGGGCFASDLLLWLFLPALWRVFEEATRPGVTDPAEIEAEILLGFWEAVSEHNSSQKLSGKLINAARHRAWQEVHRALQVAQREEGLDRRPEDLHSTEANFSDPWLVICRARLEAILDETETELIFWTRLQDEPLRKVGRLLDLSEATARSCRHRAERRLAGWLGGSDVGFPPADPDLAQKVLSLAQKSSPLAQVLRPNLPRNDPDFCL